jgi:UDP-N-acetyl-D-galactosamine dehydrogenase
MSHFIAQKINKLLMQQGFTAIGAKVLLLGVTFKENCPDIRNSKVFEIVQELQQMGMDVSVFDPFANAQEVMTTHHIQLITELHQYDAIVLTVAHDFFKSLNYASLKTNSNAVIYDTKALLDKSIVTARL